MRKNFLLSVFVIAITLPFCKTQQPPSRASEGMQSCEGLPGLAFQNIEDSTNATRVAKFAADVAAAAKIDASKSAQVPLPELHLQT